MRLIFLFTSHGAAPRGTRVSWSSNVTATNKYAVGEGGLHSEGYLFLLKRMVEEGIVDEVIIFIESNRGTGSTHYRIKKGLIPCYVVPEIAYVDDYLKPDDIIWARGGFRGWWEWLNSKKGKHWLLLYAADTGRERWMFWDVIFNDLGKYAHLDRRKRFWFPFRKPVHEGIFKPLNLEQKYDVCIGASHIHDKKAQWKMIEVASEYKRLFNTDLHCVLPGAARRGTKSNLIHEKIRNYELKIDVVGLRSRKEMNLIYNQSKLFVYLGYGGQNDRGPLESLRCGTPIILASYKRHASFFNKDHTVVRVAHNSEDFKEVAIDINFCLKNEYCTREETAQFFEESSGVETIILPEMKRLFDVLGNSKLNYKVLEREYMNEKI